jgi:hypothetical protein
LFDICRFDEKRNSWLPGREIKHTSPHPNQHSILGDVLALAKKQQKKMSFDGEGGEKKQLGVLLAGYLEKQNPYGKVFRKRFVVLTQEAFHWFKVHLFDPLVSS